MIEETKKIPLSLSSNGPSSVDRKFNKHFDLWLQTRHIFLRGIFKAQVQFQDMLIQFPSVSHI